MKLPKKEACLGALLLLCMTFGSFECHGHSHDHDHDHAEVNPAFKYSRAANEDPVIPEDEIWEEEIIDLPPQKFEKGHGHSHEDHGHSHGGHGHSHGGHGHSHGGHGHSHGGNSQKEPTPEERERLRRRLHDNWDDDDDEPAGRDVWFQAISATLLISAAPFFILFFIPLDNSEEKQWLLKIVLSFASGGLLGDAFLHLIPHAMVSHAPEGGHGHSHSHGHSHGEGHSHDMSVGLGVLSGILAFLCVEKLVRIINNGGGHGHSHGPKPKPKPKDAKVTEGTDKDKKKKEDEKKDSKSDSQEKVSADCQKSEEKSEIKIAGFLNLFADCFHNFTDGLAIGASFIAGEGVGKITTLTILLHEVPHEIGDYAILIQSGMPPMKAILMQLVTALGALTGCVFSLLAPRGLGESAASTFILPFTAGGFIYIATVSVIPELLEGSKLKQSILEILALLAGVGMMVIIAQFE